MLVCEARGKLFGKSVSVSARASSPDLSFLKPGEKKPRPADAVREVSLLRPSSRRTATLPDAWSKDPCLTGTPLVCCSFS